MKREANRAFEERLRDVAKAPARKALRRRSSTAYDAESEAVISILRKRGNDGVKVPLVRADTVPDDVTVSRFLEIIELAPLLRAVVLC